MSADIAEKQPHSLSANFTCSSGFRSYSHRGDARSMSMDELEEEYQQLREENHQLQLRILGVNELARLLQDKNEQLTLVEEKNKVCVPYGQKILCFVLRPLNSNVRRYLFSRYSLLYVASTVDRWA